MSEFFSNDTNDTEQNGYKNIPENTDGAETVNAENESGVKETEEVSESVADSKGSEGEYTYSYNKEGLAEHTGNSSSYSFPERDRSEQREPRPEMRSDGFNASYGTREAYESSSYSHGSNDFYASSNVYGSNGGYNRNAYGGYDPNVGARPDQRHAYNFESDHASKKADKKKKSESSRAVLICLICVLISGAVGLGSSFAFSKYFSGTGSHGNTSLGGGDNTVVLYRSVETVKEDGSDMSVADVSALVENSVVEITTEYVTSSNFFFGSYVTGGAGSGVIISTDGYIVTNNHVVTKTDDDSVLADKIQVRLKNGEEYDATVVGHDADSDIAVIKIGAENLTAAVWGDSDSIVVGEQIIAVGNPLGELGGTITAGIISSTSREVEIGNVTMSLIQIDAAVNHGNSGGGLFNMKGELVGIVNAKSEGNSVEGLGFAIPSNDARNISEQLLTHGYVRGKAYLGVSFYEANSGYFSGSGGESILYVYGTEAGYNDDVLMKGDMILSIDDIEVSTVAEIKSILSEHEVGDVLTFTILRGRTTMEVQVKCYEATPAGSVSFDD